MTLPTPSPAAANEARSLALVVLAYRCVMAEISGAHAKYRADVWEVFERASPPGEAETLFGSVFAFARALLAASERPLEWRRTYCAHLCRDEWLAVAMIDAAQRGDVAGLLEAAATLVRADELGDALNAAQALACALTQRGLVLCPRKADGRCASDLCPKRTIH